jgi:hypothetical protein
VIAYITPLFRSIKNTPLRKRTIINTHTQETLTLFEQNSYKKLPKHFCKRLSSNSKNVMIKKQTFRKDTIANCVTELKKGRKKFKFAQY